MSKLLAALLTLVILVFQPICFNVSAAEELSVERLEKVKKLLTSDYLAQLQAELRRYFIGMGVTEEELPDRVDPIMDSVLRCIMANLDSRSQEKSISLDCALDEYLAADADSTLVRLSRSTYEEESTKCIRAFKRQMY